MLAVHNRLQTELVLLTADPSTGKTSVLLTDKDPAWINLHKDMPRWLSDGSGFLWTTEHRDDQGDGGPALGLYDKNGSLTRTLVPASVGYQGFVDVDVKAGGRRHPARPHPPPPPLYLGAHSGGAPA